MPRSKYLLDPAAIFLDAGVPASQPAEAVAAGSAPCAGLNDKRDTAFGRNGRGKMPPPTTAIGKPLARSIGQGAATGAAIVEITRRNRDFLDERYIGTDMDFISMDSLARAVTRPGRLLVFVTR